jgi:hypothetical protein
MNTPAPDRTPHSPARAPPGQHPDTGRTAAPDRPRAPDVADPHTGEVRLLARRCAQCMFSQPWPTPHNFADPLPATHADSGHLVPEAAPPGTTAAIRRGLAAAYTQLCLALRLGRTTVRLAVVTHPARAPAPCVPAPSALGPGLVPEPPPGPALQPKDDPH